MYNSFMLNQLLYKVTSNFNWLIWKSIQIPIGFGLRKIIFAEVIIRVFSGFLDAF